MRQLPRGAYGSICVNLFIGEHSAPYASNFIRKRRDSYVTHMCQILRDNCRAAHIAPYVSI
ncbi:MAG TPA: hypothetical protein PLI57_12055 [Spirochaetota bacterium]|nr:hypothetical protein [Spirochaetota bacterium]